MSLEQAVEHAVTSYQRRTGAEVSLKRSQLPSDSQLPVKITVFRVLQEALTNGYRHAGGLEQKVGVSVVDDQISIVVSDSGPGFSWPNPEHEGRLGIAGMHERVELLGGSFEVASGPGIGTRIEVTLPLWGPGADVA